MAQIHAQTRNKRLFFALSLSSEQKQYIHQWAQQCVAPAILKTTARRVPQNNLHITLSFLGQCSPEQTQQLITRAENIMAAAELKPIDVTFDRLSHWSKPKIVCLEPTQPPESLIWLANQFIHAATQLGFVCHHPNYKPHITLIRKQTTAISPDMSSHQTTHQTLLPHFPLELSQVSLYQSISTSHGVSYQPLHSWQL